MDSGSPEPPKATIIVTDAGPLVTLSVAGALDTLLLPGLRVIIPDMVRFEVTRHLDKPGAQEILDWIRKNEPEKVYVGTTEIFDEFEVLLKTNPKTRSRSRGEASASEILSRELAKSNDKIGILLFEDADITKTNFLLRLPDRVIVYSTASFLKRLEHKHLIDNARDILAKALSVRGDRILSEQENYMEGVDRSFDPF
ncbi:MAG: hypothetical protein ACYDBP_10450 [Leptospirales bacterium]